MFVRGIVWISWVAQKLNETSVAIQVSNRTRSFINGICECQASCLTLSHGPFFDNRIVRRKMKLMSKLERKGVGWTNKVAGWKTKDRWDESDEGLRYVEGYDHQC